MRWGYLRVLLRLRCGLGKTAPLAAAHLPRALLGVIIGLKTIGLRTAMARTTYVGAALTAEKWPLASIFFFSALEP